MTSERSTPGSDGNVLSVCPLTRTSELSSVVEGMLVDWIAELGRTRNARLLRDPFGRGAISRRPSRRTWLSGYTSRMRWLSAGRGLSGLVLIVFSLAASAQNIEGPPPPKSGTPSAVSAVVRGSEQGTVSLKVASNRDLTSSG